MDASVFREAIFQTHLQGRERGHYFLRSDDELIRDRHITVDGRRLLSFGSCSYLGLEFDDRLVEGATDAVRRFRSQTSYSRGYLSCPLYHALEEDLLPRVFGVPRALLLPSTSAAHHVALPAILDERDAAVVDHQVHRSVDDAVTLQCARSGARKEVVKHGELERAADAIARLARLHRRVWLFCDGVYSMYGDHLPVAFLDRVMALAPNVHLYVDDAHGMSWDGQHGRGHFLARRPLDERTVVVTSLAKAFGTGGGVIVARDPAIIELARLVGGPYSFSGPLRPADLGASCASARIHLSGELPALQQRLADRVALANRLCRELAVPLVIENASPIFFIALGRAEAVYRMAEELRDAGYHVNVSGFPAVPASRGGLRVAINACHTEAQVEALFHAVAERLPAVLAAVGVTRAELDEHFASVLPPFLRGQSELARAHRALAAVPEPAASALGEGLAVTMRESIHDVDAAHWDRLLGGLAYVDAASMRAVESVFDERSQALPEHRWRFRYLFVKRDEEVVAAAPFTRLLLKDDIFMTAEVSEALEQRRERDPYLFTSAAFATGTMASEGLHVHLTDGPDREAALVRLVGAAVSEARAQGARMVIVGDFPDPGPLSGVFSAHGFVPMRLLDNHVIALDWRGEEEFVERPATRTARNHLRAIRAQAPRFRREVWTAASDVGDDVVAYMHELYMRLARKNRRINIFPLPASVLRAHIQTPGWDFLALFDRERPSRFPVAYAAGRVVAGEARWLYCGVDYAGYDVEVTSPYRQMLWEILRHSAERGAERVHLGMGADFEKRRFGSTPVPTYAFVRSDDDYQAAKLQELVEELATSRAPRAVAR
jgi:7-keto-8-aminopelargonate synthetase-like enzyme